jgi:hypothetical protein
MTKRVIDTDHPDATEEAKFRLMGIRQAMGNRPAPTLAKLKKACDDEVKRGTCTDLKHIVMLGLELPLDQYEALVIHAARRTKQIKRPSRRIAA